jgi:DNA topoisomerase IB
VVWICSRTNGNLRAAGIDVRGRKQYKCHPSWRAVRDEAKFEKLLSFAEALPKIRAQVHENMRRPNLTREKVLATVVRLLEVSLIRIGNEGYAGENKSLGLTITSSYLDGTLARTLRVKADYSRISHHLSELKPEETAVLALLRQGLAERPEKDRPPRRL